MIGGGAALLLLFFLAIKGFSGDKPKEPDNVGAIAAAPTPAPAAAPEPTPPVPAPPVAASTEAEPEAGAPTAEKPPEPQVAAAPPEAPPTADEPKADDEPEEDAKPDLGAKTKAAKPTVSVTFKTDPEGASVATKTKTYGTTPKAVKLTPGNSYDLTFTKAGYVPATKHFVAPAAGKSAPTVRVSLKKVPEPPKAKPVEARSPPPPPARKGWFSR
jgi:hypothetical protein